MLMPELNMTSRLTRLRDAVQEENETIDGVECIRVTGISVRGDGQPGDKMTLWLESKSLLLRQIYSEHDFPASERTKPFKTQTTTSYQPVLNKDVPDELLQLDAPRRP
jgi:hypothetical protein